MSIVITVFLSACALDILHLCPIEEQKTDQGIRTCITRDWRYFSNQCKAELWFGDLVKPKDTQK